MTTLTKYDRAAHRKECVRKAIEDGYFETAYSARQYYLCEDGRWVDKMSSQMWFDTHVSLDDYSIN